MYTVTYMSYTEKETKYDMSRSEYYYDDPNEFRGRVPLIPFFIDEFYKTGNILPIRYSMGVPVGFTLSRQRVLRVLNMVSGHFSRSTTDSVHYRSGTFQKPVLINEEFEE